MHFVMQHGMLSVALPVTVGGWPPSRGQLLTPDYIEGGGKMVSHEELYAFVMMLIAFATLIYRIAKKK